jgi:hypothetical protein
MGGVEEREERVQGSRETESGEKTGRSHSHLKLPAPLCFPSPSSWVAAAHLQLLHFLVTEAVALQHARLGVVFAVDLDNGL